MPAANSSENQAPSENSGSSSSFPRRMSPNRLKPMNTAKTTKKAAINT
jgi:hypothetical protein